jgi:hypothetical protein
VLKRQTPSSGVHGIVVTCCVCMVEAPPPYSNSTTMYMEFEAADAVQQSRLRPRSCPVPRKEDCIQWMASVWSSPDFHAAVADGFWKTGLACSLHGADDHRVVKEAAAFWNEFGIPAKR